MNLAQNNFGLSGQSAEDYDDFLCFGQKCKKRKEERHQARMDKKQAKTDAMKADTERIRAETKVIEQTATAPQTVGISGMATMAMPQFASAEGAGTPAPQPGKSGMNGIVIAVVAVLLLAGGYFIIKKKKGAALPPKVVAAA